MPYFRILEYFQLKVFNLIHLCMLWFFFGKTVPLLFLNVCRHLPW